jgi:hypothetical protein
MIRDFPAVMLLEQPMITQASDTRERSPGPRPDAVASSSETRMTRRTMGVGSSGRPSRGAGASGTPANTQEVESIREVLLPKRSEEITGSLVNSPFCSDVVDEPEGRGCSVEENAKVRSAPVCW